MITIRPIEKRDDKAVEQIIKNVGAEFGAIGEGFGPSDAEVSAMSQYYSLENKSVYLVVEVDGLVVGGCGIAQYLCNDDVCELKKLFLLPTARGLKLGTKLTEACLVIAVELGYERCYLDTLSTMKSAIALYEKLGFEQLKEPFGHSIHTGCDVWMMKNLIKQPA